MKASEGKIGRVFVLRLEDGDTIPTCIERFAAEKSIKVGHVILIGDVNGGNVVVGPRKSDESPYDPMSLPLDGAHEMVGLGIIAPDKDGKPIVHIHAALGRSGQTMTGCLRNGVNTWLITEAVLYEITGSSAKRLPNPESGFNLMQV